MVTVQEIINAMETLAPIHLAESWDNSGLMVGDRAAVVTGVLTTLDLTTNAIQQAIKTNCNLIISHHPLIFKGVKHIDKSDALGNLIFSLIENNIAVYSAHTNLDVTEGGLNDMLASALGLTDVKGFIKTSSRINYKVTTFCPIESSDAVRYAMGQVGAGVIGDYTDCSFTTTGTGRFKGNDESNPVVGEKEVLATVAEECINVIVSKKDLPNVLAALMAAHPYEEVAYEVIQLEAPQQHDYLGRIGTLPKVMTLDELKQKEKNVLGISQVRCGGVPCDAIKRIALCSGAGASFIGDLNTQNVDAYITGDMKYHDAQLAKEKGLLVVDAGHFGTEHIVANGLAQYLNGVSSQKNWGNLPIIAFEEQEDFFF